LTHVVARAVEAALAGICRLTATPAAAMIPAAINPANKGECEVVMSDLRASAALTLDRISRACQ